MNVSLVQKNGNGYIKSGDIQVIIVLFFSCSMKSKNNNIEYRTGMLIKKDKQTI